MLRLISFQLKSSVPSSHKILSGSSFVGGSRVGVLLPNVNHNGTSDQLLDLTSYITQAGSIKLPSKVNEVAIRDMNYFIEAGNDLVDWVRTVLRDNNNIQSSVRRTSDIQLLPPLFPRRNLICVGKNYKDHVAEVANADKERGIGTTSATSANASEAPKYAQFFTKLPSTVVPHEGKVQNHAEVTKWLDYEAELAVIIGKQGTNITPEKAMEHVFGFTIANDITARDVQRHHNQWFRGKSLDTTCPLGPAILHASSPIDPFNLNVRLWLNQQKMQDSNTKNMIFTIPEIIRQLSVGLTLMPGDVILTGTPEGVGYARKPPIVLKAGDHMAIEIEHIGRLENTVE